MPTKEKKRKEDCTKECIRLESEDINQEVLDKVIGMLLKYTKT